MRLEYAALPALLRLGRAEQVEPVFEEMVELVNSD
jgi:hypothetical protein